MFEIKLNLGRNCLKYIIKAYGIREIFIPYYICPVIIKAVREEGCKIHFYHIDNNFIPMREFSPENFILYVNYFGLNTKNCETLAKKYKNLIVDNSHACFAPVSGLACFNSLRKFFPVPNGAYLYINKRINDKPQTDNFTQQPVLFHENYEKFVENELNLNRQTEIKILSGHVDAQIKNIDFNKNLRKNLFYKYAEVFDKFNKLKISPETGEVPYCYPLSPNDKNAAGILADEFCILRLWKPMPHKFPEYDIFNTVLALPLEDEKYCKRIIRRFKK